MLDHMIPWYETKHDKHIDLAVDMYLTSRGHDSDMCCMRFACIYTCLGEALDKYCTCLAHVIVMYWTCIEHVLGVCSFGDML